MKTRQLNKFKIFVNFFFFFMYVALFKRKTFDTEATSKKPRTSLLFF